MQKFRSFLLTEPLLTHRLRKWVAGVWRAWLLRLACASWRKQCSGLDDLDRRLAAKEPLILVFWHAKYLCLLPLLRKRRAVVFTSKSSRGDIIRSVLERFGYRACQLPDHGGDQSLKLMSEVLADGSSGAIAVDGPLGPRHVVHRGAIQLASDLGHALIPASVAICPRHEVSTRWDSLALPYPFSRVCLVIGEPIRVPRGIEGQAIACWSAKVGAALDEVDDRATRCLSDPPGRPAH